MTLTFNFDNSYARLPDRFFASGQPTPVAAPFLIKANSDLAADLGLDPEMLHGDEALNIFAGNLLPEGAASLSQAYSGHQFGGWSPQLGDGRAHLLGEVVTPDGARMDIQLKGSGPTKWSRNGDGRSWLGPVIREYLVSEAMHKLGVPTTRALAAVRTGETVRRERALPGGVLTRVASSHLRVGTFQYFAARKDTEGLQTLLDHAIARHTPDAASAKDPAMAFFETVIARQVELVTHWMRLGFIHGVMNTDNTSISGETIDYGPCAFMDDFHPAKVFSSIDTQGRYAYQNQPDILIWNLAQLGGAILPLMQGEMDDAAETATAALRKFPDLYRAAWLTAFRAKLGLSGEFPEDAQLIEDLLRIMAEEAADFTNTFRALNTDTARGEFTNHAAFDAWRERWLTRRLDGADEAAMEQANPAVIPRNHRIEAVIQAGVAGDFKPFEDLHRVLSKPYALSPEDQHFAAAPSASETVTATFCGT